MLLITCTYTFNSNNMGIKILGSIQYTVYNRDVGSRISWNPWKWWNLRVFVEFRKLSAQNPFLNFHGLQSDIHLIAGLSQLMIEAQLETEPQLPDVHNYYNLLLGLKARFPLAELTARVDGWPVSITRQHGPCWRAHDSTSRVDLASGNAHPSTPAVNSGRQLV